MRFWMPQGIICTCCNVFCRKGPPKMKYCRPLLLDGISMLQLVKENDLAEVLRNLQGELMGFMRGDRMGCLSDVLDIQKLKSAAKQYEKLIIQTINDLL